MAASGLRSSWEASATNWRTFVSLACRAASASSTLLSMWLNACPTRPTSDVGSASSGGTRTASATSPRSSGSCETCWAVAATRFSGRRLRRTTVREATTAPPMARPVSTVSRPMSWASWWSTSLQRDPPERLALRDPVVA